MGGNLNTGPGPPGLQGLTPGGDSVANCGEGHIMGPAANTISAMRETKRELQAFNFKRWIDEHRHLLKPPVGNKLVFTDSEFIIMVVGGPNAAAISTSIRARNFSTSSKAASRSPPCRMENAWTSPSAKARSSCCRLTCRTRPRRPANTVGLVIERTRRAGELDGFQWYCENCGTRLYEEFVEVTNIETQLPPVFDRFFGSPAHRTCRQLRHGHGPAEVR